ncbi:protein of unknown function [Methylorubrum extorquens]|uniref:DNA protecting protein DprA n=1 Tax=Methylorubrum extorquens TaxID=408 RepID=A0A2N9ANV0_METEX|nr:protein of unknown function [Methylorubrum extorquens]
MRRRPPRPSSCGRWDTERLQRSSSCSQLCYGGSTRPTSADSPPAPRGGSGRRGERRPLPDGGGPMQLTDAQRLDWLRLIRTDGIGPRTFRGLINRFGSASAALDALPDLTKRAGKRAVPPTTAEAEREMAAAARLGIRFLAMGEAAYPKALHATDTAPPLIAVRGDPATLLKPSVAIVGSRNASTAGLAFTERLARGFGEAGLVVVSGLARGDRRPRPQGDAHHRHRRGPRGWAGPDLSGEPCRPRRGDRRGGWGGGRRDADGLGAARARLSPPQPHHLRPQPRHRHRGGRAPLRLAHHRPLRAGAGPGGLRGARLAARSAGGGHQRPDPPGRDAGLGGRARPVGARSADRRRRAAGGRPERPLRDLAHARLLGRDRFRRTSRDRAAAASRRGGADRGSPPEPRDDRARLIACLSPTPVGTDELARSTGLPVRIVQTTLLELELDGRIERHGSGTVSLVSRA